MKPKKRRTGFTLIELLIVVSILGILIGIIFGSASYVMDGQARKRAKTEIKMLEIGVEEYRRVFGHYPICKSKVCSSNEVLFMALAGLHGDVGPLSPRLKPFLNLSHFNIDKNKFDPVELMLKETHDATTDTLLFVKIDLKNLAFLDPWDNEYVYEYPRDDGLSEFRVRSLGPDGKGGEGFDADNVE